MLWFIGQRKRHHWILILPILSHLPRGRKNKVRQTSVTGKAKRCHVPTAPTLTKRWAVGRVLPRKENRGRCCPGVVWWRSIGSSQLWSDLWISAIRATLGCKHVRHHPVRRTCSHTVSHLRTTDSPYRPPWCLNPTSWLSDPPTAAVSHRGSRRGWSQPRDLPSIYCRGERTKHQGGLMPQLHSTLNHTGSLCLQLKAKTSTLWHGTKPGTSFKIQ